MRRIELNLLPYQKELLNSKDPFVFACFGRGAGKSYTLSIIALLALLQGKNAILCAQRYDSLKDVLFREIKLRVIEWGLGDAVQFKENPVRAMYNGYTLYGGSFDAIPALRGLTEISLIIIDECALAPIDILDVLAPCLRGPGVVNPRIIGATTPNAQSQWNLRFAEAEKYGWRLLTATTYDNKFLTQEQIRIIEQAIPSKEMRDQELYAKIITSGSAFAILHLYDFTFGVQPFHDDGVYAGLDMAHKGERDGHVFCAVQGNRLLALHEFGECDHMTVAGWIKRFHEKHPIKALNIDLFWSELVYEQLRYTVACRQISFAERAPDEEDQRKFANIRAWGYFRLASHTRDGLVWDVGPSEFIDSDIVSELKREACNTHFLRDRTGRILIEPKEDIKARLGRSPDVADAAMLACIDRPSVMDPAIVAREQQADSRERDELEAIMSED